MNKCSPHEVRLQLGGAHRSLPHMGCALQSVALIDTPEGSAAAMWSTPVAGHIPQPHQVQAGQGALCGARGAVQWSGADTAWFLSQSPKMHLLSVGQQLTEAVLAYLLACAAYCSALLLVCAFLWLCLPKLDVASASLSVLPAVYLLREEGFSLHRQCEAHRRHA